MVRAWHAWKRLARRIGDIQGRVLLWVVYYVVLPPFALLTRAGADPFGRGRSSGWHEREHSADDLRRSVTRQY